MVVGKGDRCQFDLIARLWFAANPGSPFLPSTGWEMSSRYSVAAFALVLLNVNSLRMGTMPSTPIISYTYKDQSNRV